MKKRCGILFFAREPKVEAMAKRWTPSARKNLRLARTLYNHTLSVIRKSKLPVFIADTQTQQGLSFSDRMANALTDFFCQGYEQVIVVGSDCGDLNLQDIQRAHQNLENGNNTIGASFDGGVYLFTLSNTAFNAERFEQLPWCSSKLKKALRSELVDMSNNGVSELDMKADVDSNLADLIPFLRYIRGQIGRMICQVIFCIQNFTQEYLILLQTHAGNFSYRGPPGENLVTD